MEFTLLADGEAVKAMKHVLDSNEYEGNTLCRPSELGGKLLAEGVDIEASLVTMSVFRQIKGCFLRQIKTCISEYLAVA